MNNFTIRTITGFFFVVVLIGSILLSPYAYLVVFLAILTGTLLEFYKLVLLKNVKPLVYFGLFCGFAMFILTFFHASGLTGHNYLLLLLPLFFVIPFAGLFMKDGDPFSNIVWTLFGLFYIAIPLSLLNYIRFHEDTALNLIFYFLIVWTYDSAAYLVGITLGKHRLFERISPKKSWEGAIGGAILTLIITWLISGYFSSMSPYLWMILAGIIVLAGTLGDLTESLFKRGIGVKDSGNMLPGHGGFLDRFDAILLTSPFVFTFLQLFG